MPYIGDQSFIDNIEKFLVSPKKHHALMFVGNKSIGKATAAKQIIANIINKQNGNEIYNLKWISPTGNKSEKITIEQIREIHEFINQTNFDGKYKFIVIDSADDLNINAANSLLKPLEECPANSFFILICHKLNTILPTIKSRCVQFKFSTPKQKHLKEIIQLNTESSLSIIDNLLKISSNNLNQALSIAKSASILDFYQFLLEQLKSSTFRAVNLEEVIDKNDFDSFWKAYFYLLKRVLYILLNRNAVLIEGEELFIRDLTLGVDVEMLTKLIEEINEIEYKISTLYLSKRDCFQVYILKVHELCQRIFI